MALLKGFEAPTEESLGKLWKEGHFVLDTSVLLNLHRYRKPVRDDVLSALDKVKDRLWVPYHVALEYERNRAGVVASKKSTIRKVRDKVSSLPELLRGSLQDMDVFRRHSHIEMNDLIEKLSTLSTNFCKELEDLDKSTADVHESDDVRAKIENLLSGRIGAAPSDQSAVDAVNQEGAVRFARQQPPGFMDDSKGEGKELPMFVYGGLEYQRKYGDLYVWDQLKKWSASLKGSPVCFVTDDVKQDWWWLVESGGSKRLGPRAELKEEIFREAGIEFFHMYSPDAFLEALNKFRGAGINPESVSEARELSQARLRKYLFAPPSNNTASFGISARAAIKDWLSSQATEGGSSGGLQFPDFVHIDADAVVDRGYEVIPMAAVNANLIRMRIERRLANISEFLETNPKAELRLFFVFRSSSSAKAAFKHLRDFDWLSERIALCAGYLHDEDSRYNHLGCVLRASASETIAIG